MIQRVVYDEKIKYQPVRRVVSKRLSDRRLWKSIEENGCQKAASRLTRGFAYLCWGAGTRAVVWREIRGTYREPFAGMDDDSLEFLYHCKKEYLAWCNICEKKGINHRVVMDVLYFGKSLSEIDKDHGRRHGWAHQNILAALALYTK